MVFRVVNNLNLIDQAHQQTTIMDQFKTKEDILKMGIIDPELDEILKHSPAPHMDLSLPVDHLRGMATAMEKKKYETCPTFDTQESTMNISMRDGYQSELNIVKPPMSSSGNPVVVIVFGGGFLMGSNIQSIDWARATAALYGATVVRLSYRLAPEHKFPYAPNDVWDTVKWIAANQSALDADLSKGFVIGGGSAGGNLSIVTAHRAAKDKLNPPITGVLTCIPICISKETLPEKYKEFWLSREQNAAAPGNPGMDSKSIELYQALYQQDYFSEDFSPFASTTPWADLGLPRTYVQIAGLDNLRDDGLIYAKALEDSGVEVRFDAYPGMPHGHFNMWPHLKQSIKSQEDTIWHTGWLLRREVPRDRVADIVAKMT